MRQIQTEDITKNTSILLENMVLKKNGRRVWEAGRNDPNIVCKNE
jgi:hypothetical protein